MRDKYLSFDPSVVVFDKVTDMPREVNSLFTHLYVTYLKVYVNLLDYGSKCLRKGSVEFKK